MKYLLALLLLLCSCNSRQSTSFDPPVINVVQSLPNQDLSPLETNELVFRRHLLSTGTMEIFPQGFVLEGNLLGCRWLIRNGNPSTSILVLFDILPTGETGGFELKPLEEVYFTSHFVVDTTALPTIRVFDFVELVGVIQQVNVVHLAS